MDIWQFPFVGISNIKMDQEFKNRWEKVKQITHKRFGEEIDLQAILFIIGLQELAHGHRKLTKDQKVDVLHIAVCTLLTPYGYYKYEGRDEDDWPHWSSTSKLPYLKQMEQEKLIKEAIMNYFGV